MTNTQMPECGHARLAVRLLDSSTPSNCPTVSTWQSIVGAMSVGQYLLAETDCNLWFPAQLVIAWHCACSISLPLLSYRHTELFFDGLSIQTCTAQLVLPALCAHEDVPDVFWKRAHVLQGQTVSRAHGNDGRESGARLACVCHPETQCINDPSCQGASVASQRQQGNMWGGTSKRDSCFVLPQISHLWNTSEGATPFLKTLISSSMVMVLS
jgi:hypothetical protein